MGELKLGKLDWATLDWVKQSSICLQIIVLGKRGLVSPDTEGDYEWWLIQTHANRYVLADSEISCKPSRFKLLHFLYPYHTFMGKNYTIVQNVKQYTNDNVPIHSTQYRVNCGIYWDWNIAPNTGHFSGWDVYFCQMFAYILTIEILS